MNGKIYCVYDPETEIKKVYIEETTIDVNLHLYIYINYALYQRLNTLLARAMREYGMSAFRYFRVWTLIEDNRCADISD